MSPGLIRRAWLVGVSLLLTACAATPPPRFHSLVSAQPEATVTTAATAPAFSLELGPVGVPPGVDQPQWVLRLPDDSLRVLERERWVAPLRDELRAALMQRLSQRWGAVDARTAITPSALPAWRLRVDVLRVESLPGHEVWLEASWSITGTTALACTATLREAAPGDVLALAAAHRRAVAKLADEIGTQLLARSRGQKTGCVP